MHHLIGTSLARNMDNVVNEKPCWSRAYRCPNSASNSISSSTGFANQSRASCEAWYRCDGVANYVINWWCHGLSGMTVCDNSSSSRRMDTQSCPPPVVCPGTMKDLDTNVQVTKDNAIDVDIILAVVLAIFALLVLALMFILGYKHWLVRRRHHRRFYHGNRPDRPYRALSPPSRSAKHKGSWIPAWGGMPRQLKFVGKSGTVNGIHYADVYIPSQSQSGTLLHRQHHIDERAISHNNFNNNHNITSNSSNYWGVYRTGPASPKQRRKVKRAGKFPGDRFVATGSFVYQPSSPPRRTWRNAHINNHNRDRRSSGGRRDVYSPKGNSRRWTAMNSLRMQELQHAVNNHSVRSPSTVHYDMNSGFYFKGHNRENYIENSTPSSIPVCYYVNSPTPEYHSIMSSNNSTSSNDNNRTDFKERSVPQVSSIQIPSYEGSSKTDNVAKNKSSLSPYDLSKKYNLLLSNTSYDAMKDPYLNHGYQRDNLDEHNGSDCGSLRSNLSVSPYAMGRIHCRDGGCGMSEAASIASKNWHYTVFSQQQQQQQQQHNAVINSGNTTNFIVDKPTDVVRASSMKNNSNYFLNSYYKPTPNSPDVVSSHNVSHRVTHITQDSSSAHHHQNHHQQHHHHRRSEMNARQQQQQQHQHSHRHHVQQDHVARITVPSYTQKHLHQEFTSTEINGGNIKGKSGNSDNLLIDRHYSQRVHIPGNVHGTWSSSNSDEGNVLKSQELSYDCFRNEHLRQLARQETVASASTLDKTVGQLSTNDIRGIPHHYY